MKFTNIIIRDSTTGEHRAYTESFHEDDTDTLEFLWGEGNYACDCNRALFFARAGGKPDPKNRPCGDTRYQVRVEVGGKVIYDELEEGS